MSERILIMGAGASQGLFGETLTDPTVIGDRPLPELTFCDPNPNVVLREGLPNLAAAAALGKVQFVTEIPTNSAHDYSVAVIATASGNHGKATGTVLERLQHQDRLPFFVLEKPLAATPEDLALFRDIEQQYPDLRSMSNEPYLFSNGVDTLLDIIEEEYQKDNPLREVWAWSSKKRARVNRHGALDIFGIEFPHTHGAASLIAGEVLGADQTKVAENVYFRDVDDIPDNDGNYVRLELDELTVNIAQGLGQFVMDQNGGMRWHDDQVPRIRCVGLRFEKDVYVELDIERALDRYCPPAFLHPGRIGNSTIWRYRVKDGDLKYQQDGEEQYIPDDPRRRLAGYLLDNAADPSTPALPRVSFQETLARSAALLALRATATERYGVVSRWP